MELIVVLVIAIIASVATMVVLTIKLERAKADAIEMEQRADIDRHQRIDSATNDSVVRERVRRVYTRNDPKE